jgi:hypothetical protein
MALFFAGRAEPPFAGAAGTPGLRALEDPGLAAKVGAFCGSLRPMSMVPPRTLHQPFLNDELHEVISKVRQIRLVVLDRTLSVFRKRFDVIMRELW